MNRLLRAFAVTALAVLPAAAPPPTPLPAATSTPRALVWDGLPATHFRLEMRTLDLSPDGEMRILARAVLLDAQGAITHLRSGGDFDFFASRGRVQWQTRLRFDGPAAIVRVRRAGPLAVRAVANLPRGLGTQRASLNVSAAGGVVVRPLGSRTVVAGWFPAAGSGRVRVERTGTGPALTRSVPLTAGSLTDDTVRPGGHYQYVVHRPRSGPIVAAVDVPLDLPPSAVAAIRGKSAWLAFSGAPWDPDGYPRLDPPAMAAQAAAAGLHAVFLRLAYGEFWESTAPAAPTVDALIDAFAARGIAVVGWTVPREPSFEDLAAAVTAAAYRTPAGHGIAGLAVDLERGEEYFGTGTPARDAMARYAARLRSAVGPRTVIVATVEDPFLEHLDDRAVPYAAIAASSDVVQPMTYWRALHGGATPERVRTSIAGAVRTVRRLAGRPVAVAVGAQTSDIGNGTGAPAVAEVAAATREARRLGAVGVTYYDWSGTSPALWRALTTQRW